MQVRLGEKGKEVQEGLGGMLGLACPPQLFGQVISQDIRKHTSLPPLALHPPVCDYLLSLNCYEGNLDKEE